MFCGPLQLVIGISHEFHEAIKRQTGPTQEEKLMLAVAPKAGLEMFGPPKRQTD